MDGDPFTPNDGRYRTWQCNLNNIGQTGGAPDACEAWDMTTGSSDIIIAIVDTGLDLDHPHLDAKMVAGWDFTNQDGDPDDDHGHGTQVAG